MILDPVRQTLRSYESVWPSAKIAYEGLDRALEHKTVSEISQFVETHADALERSCVKGHLTASALVINPSMTRVLLMLHAKLGKWLQLGGHADGDSDLAGSALREAREESGREEVQFFSWEKAFDSSSRLAAPLPFDCDVHEIPARRSDPSHFHYDIRYLCVLDDSLPLIINEESHDLRWLTLDEARSFTTELSMLRQFAKLEAI
ncbi:MAG: NUDIX domain-containing protein, partial [Proteobacteria bacterium]